MSGKCLNSVIGFANLNELQFVNSDDTPLTIRFDRRVMLGLNRDGRRNL
jgi:hypothetical protein